MRRGGRAQRERGERGQSLVELLVAIVLVGMVFLAITLAILTVVRSSGSNRRIQSIDTALVSYGEVIRDRTLVPYTACAAAGTSGSTTVASAYQTSAALPAAMSTSNAAVASDTWRKPVGMVVEVVGIDAWSLSNSQFVTGCAVPDGGAQRVTYKITYEGSSRTGQTIKRMAGPA